ncbi:SH3 domain-containing kinase-binding protein 1 [Hondaea fermentalgiana]|uniref:SH3 domain-containing kinase-binding protein 1 n=1 Tax=Hondaea fermentalgiana TaxID=2315210 RepID=A0A2R5G0W0_9STRA|nr:SH3 domain-containing kinase-binding protein 1 [Hondaea fermentalgiana]|eukprot:GBG23929.1 SH3 domain-containing kinase-binding protein 1 [Hondaea fermentalgiana]
MKSFKMMKRRSVQKLMVTSGKSEPTLYDASYETLVQEFLTLERHLTSILGKLKSSRRATERSCAVHAALASYFSLPFVDTTEQQSQIIQQHRQQHEPGKAEEGEALGSPASHPFTNGVTQSTHPHDSLYVADCYYKLHTNVQTSAMKVLQDQAIDKLERILKEDFPARKRLIAQDAGLRTDVESYRRRVRALTDKGREGNDPSLQKFTAKLESASNEYQRKHQELSDDLTSFCANRKTMLEPIYSAFVATQLELHAFMAHQLREIVNQAQTFDSVENARESVQDYIIAGGVPALKSKPKEHLFSRLQNRLAGKHHAKGTLGHPVHQDLNSPQSSSMTSPQSYSDVGDGKMSNGGPGPTSPGFGQNSQSSHAFASPGSISQTSTDIPGDENEQKNGSSLDATASAPMTNGSEKSGAASPPTAPASAMTLGSQASIRNGTSEKGTPPAQRSPQPAMSPDGHELYIATFTFDPVDDGDLAFKKNDIIKVLEKIDEGWWRCELDGREGVVPTTYIKRYET